MPLEIKLRGAGLLKVVSIILIILGAITAASGFLSPNSGATLVNVLGVDPIAIQYFRIQGVISLATGVVMLVCGIAGVRLNNRADKAGLLLVLGIIHVVVSAFTTLYSYVMMPVGIRIMEEVQQAVQEMGSAMAGNMNVSGMMQNVPLMMTGFILPALYIVGALLNKLPPKVPKAPTAPPWAAEAEGPTEAYVPAEAYEPTEAEKSAEAELKAEAEWKAEQ